jgi:hypothetical protein
MPARSRQAAPPTPAPAPPAAQAGTAPPPGTIEEILEHMSALAAITEQRNLTEEEATRYETLEAELAAARRSNEIRNRQTAYETPVPGDVPMVAGAADGFGAVPSLMPDRQGLADLHAGIIGRSPVVVTTPAYNAAVTTTQTGKPSTPLGVTGRGGPIRIAELAGITSETVEWGGQSMFPILGAGTPPSATGEGVAKPEYDAVTPGTASPQTLAIWTDLSNQALSIENLGLKLQNKLARLVASGENNLLRAKVVGTAGVVTQAFTAGDQAVQILRSAAIIEADMNQRPDLLIYNPADVLAIFGTAVSNAAPAEIAELSVRLFGMLSLPMTAQTAGFVTMGAWAAGSRLVVGLPPTYATDPFSQLKSNKTTVLLEEAVDLAVEEPIAFRIVDIVTP